MIPEFGLGSVLPPFMDGDAVGAFAPRSPYPATMSDLVRRFATSPERCNILRGLKAFRAQLRAVGFEDGYQWIDGSFVEACEAVKGRPPGDVDVVSVLHRPPDHASNDAWGEFVDEHADKVLDQAFCKATYSCDAYFIDLDIPPKLVSGQAAYWFSLFSHQRATFQWKGLVQIDLQDDDEEAMRVLSGIERSW